MTRDWKVGDVLYSWSSSRIMRIESFTKGGNPRVVDIDDASHRDVIHAHYMWHTDPLKAADSADSQAHYHQGQADNYRSRAARFRSAAEVTA